MNKRKSFLIASISLILLILFSLNSKTVVSSVKYSLVLCYTSVIPSLFPFFILCEFAMHAIGVFGKNIVLTAYMTSLVTGFPTGVKNVCTLYENGLIDKNKATALLHCTANASPAYIINFIGLCIMKNKSIGYVIFLSQFLSSFICALFFGCFSKNNKHIQKRSQVISITDSACTSICNSVTSCLYICGYIVFFGVVADIITDIKIADHISKLFFFLPKDQVRATIVGFVEITRGVLKLDFNSKMCAVYASVIAGFSGISVIMQCINCTVKSSLPFGPIIKGKIIYAILMPLLTYCLISVVPIKKYYAFSNNNPVLCFATFIIFIIFCSIMIYIIFDKSKYRIYNKNI